MPRTLVNLAMGSVYLLWLAQLLWDASEVGPLHWTLFVGGAALLYFGVFLLASRNHIVARSNAKRRTPQAATLCWLALMGPTLAFGTSELLVRHRFLSRQVDGRFHHVVEAMPERDQFMKDREQMSGMYRDYHIYSKAPMDSPTIRFSNFYSARDCPDSAPVKSADKVIWTFGGSTMVNLETSDRRTIANQIAKVLNESGQTTAVFNFGTGAFQSCLESVKFQDLLRRVPESQRPTDVVFYDGFNDPAFAYLCGAGNVPMNFSRKLAMLVEQDHGSVLQYAAVQMLKKRSLIFDRYISRHVEPRLLRNIPEPFSSDQNLQQAVSVYLSNTRMQRAICREFGIAPVFVLQPLVVTKEGRTDFEDQVHDSLAEPYRRFIREWYTQVRSEMRNCDDFVDLSGLLDNSGRDDFYDLGHTGPFTGEVIGGNIGKWLLERHSSEDKAVVTAERRSSTKR